MNNINSIDTQFLELKKEIHYFLQKRYTPTELILEIHLGNNIRELNCYLILNDVQTLSEKDFSFVEKHINTKDLKYAIKCRGTSEISRNNKKYQRLVIIVGNDLNDLKLIEKKLDYQKEYDHRNLIKTLGLGVFHKEAPGFITWTEKGMMLQQRIKHLIRENCYKDYSEVSTPSMFKKELWEKTGHSTKFIDNMFCCDELCLTPMNCPAHVLYAKDIIKNINQLPFRIAEFGECYRNEDKGGLLGLKRARHFTQDDGHIFCTLEHIISEVDKFLNQALKIYQLFKFSSVKLKFSTRPSKYIGDIESWNDMETKIITYLKLKEYDFEMLEGEGAFYGPKIEIHVQDGHNRMWQCGTIQIDMFLSKRLGASYKDKNKERKYPIILHRAVLGSMERFLAILLEKYRGLPWIFGDNHHVTLIPLQNNILDYGWISKLLEKYPKINVNTQYSLYLRDRKKQSMKKARYVILVGEREAQEHRLNITCSITKKQIICSESQEISEFFEGI